MNDDKIDSTFDSLKEKIFKDLLDLYNNIKEFDPSLKEKYLTPPSLQLQGALTSEKQKILDQELKERDKNFKIETIEYEKKRTEGSKEFLKNSLIKFYLAYTKNKVNILSKMDNNISQFLKALTIEEVNKFQKAFNDIIENYYTNSQDEAKYSYLIQALTIAISENTEDIGISDDTYKLIDNIIKDNLPNFLLLSKLSYNIQENAYNPPNNIQKDVIKDNLISILKALSYNDYLLRKNNKN